MSSIEHDSAREYWEARYAAAERAWSGNPNPVLVQEATHLRPGRALDIGSGEGADALWLAQHGWLVTGVDIAANALAKACAHTESADSEAAARIDWQQRDLTRWQPEAGSYDLVSSQFLHLPEPNRSEVFASLAAAVAPGGTLLIVGHDVSDVGPDSPHRGRLARLMFGVQDVLAAIGDQELHIEFAESRKRHGEVPAGSEFLHDVVVKASRAPSADV